MMNRDLTLFKLFPVCTTSPILAHWLRRPARSHIGLFVVWRSFSTMEEVKMNAARFTMLKRIGKGSFGEVFKAYVVEAIVFHPHPSFDLTS